MANNDFLVFAGAGGANVITQSQYQALPSLTTGFQSGVAQSQQLNKVWRQSSIMAAMIGQFIADQSGQNATDDGTITTLEANFIAALQKLGRKKLTSALTLFVNASTGNDANNGLSAGAALRTLTAAISLIYSTYDLSGYTVTISLAAGTYTAASGTNIIQLSGPPTGAAAVGAPINIVGNVSSPGTVILSAVNADCVIVSAGATIGISGVTLTATGTGAAGMCLAAYSDGQIQIGSGMVFGTAGGCHMQVSGGGTINNIGNSYSVTGGAQIHMNATGTGSIIMSNLTCTVSGSPAFSQAFAVINALGLASFSAVTFGGTATGVRYLVTTNGVIAGSGGGATYFPGNSNGSTATGGVYA